MPKLKAFFTLLNQDVKERLLNAVLNPAPILLENIAPVGGEANKHEYGRLLHITSDAVYAGVMSTITQPANRQQLDARRTEEEAGNNGYVRLAEIFNDPSIKYDHAVPGDGDNSYDPKFTSIYEAVKEINVNIDPPRSRIKVRDARWIKDTFMKIKNVLTKVKMLFLHPSLA